MPSSNRDKAVVRRLPSWKRPVAPALGVARCTQRADVIPADGKLRVAAMRNPGPAEMVITPTGSGLILADAARQNSVRCDRDCRERSRPVG